jgi:cytochrome c biogenesis protein CcmG/thiol:disulfide interchange protein DsbE
MIYRLLALFAIITVTIWYSWYHSNQLEGMIVTDQSTESVLNKLPKATFQTLESTPLNLQQFFQSEKPELVVVHFWGTWCGPCEAELPELLDFIKRFENRPAVKFLLVAVNDDIIKIQKHLKGLSVPSGAIWLLDNKDIYRTAFGSTRVPETFVFSSDQKTLRKYLGPQEWNKPLYFQTFDEFIQMNSTRL